MSIVTPSEYDDSVQILGSLVWQYLQSVDYYKALERLLNLDIRKVITTTKFWCAKQNKALVVNNLI